jgi:hypothetical protein
MNIHKILKVLICCVGDVKQCPKCGHEFIPNTPTEQDAFKMYKKIFDECSRVVDGLP